MIGPLGLDEIVKWVEIGVCLSVGFYLVQWLGVLLVVIYSFLDR